MVWTWRAAYNARNNTTRFVLQVQETLPNIYIYIYILPTKNTRKKACFFWSLRPRKPSNTSSTLNRATPGLQGGGRSGWAVQASAVGGSCRDRWRSLLSEAPVSIFRHTVISRPPPELSPRSLSPSHSRSFVWLGRHERERERERERDGVSSRPPFSLSLSVSLSLSRASGLWQGIL